MSSSVNLDSTLLAGLDPETKRRVLAARLSTQSRGFESSYNSPQLNEQNKAVAEALLPSLGPMKFDNGGVLPYDRKSNSGGFIMGGNRFGAGDPQAKRREVADAAAERRNNAYNMKSRANDLEMQELEVKMARERADRLNRPTVAGSGGNSGFAAGGADMITLPGGMTVPRNSNAGRQAEYDEYLRASRKQELEAGGLNNKRLAGETSNYEEDRRREMLLRILGSIA